MLIPEKSSILVFAMIHFVKTINTTCNLLPFVIDINIILRNKGDVIFVGINYKAFNTFRISDVSMIRQAVFILLTFILAGSIRVSHSTVAIAAIVASPNSALAFAIFVPIDDNLQLTSQV